MADKPTQEGCKWEGCNWRSTFLKGYCFTHAKKMFPKNPKVIASEEKRIVNAKATKESNKDKTAEEMEIAVARRLAYAERQKEIDAEKKYHDIVQDQNFSLDDAIGDCKDINTEWTESLRQELFAQWQLADVETRTPKTLKEVAELLKVKQVRLRSWLDKPSFVNKMAKLRINRNSLVAAHLDKSVAIEVLQGKKSATQEFYKSITNTPLPPAAGDKIEISKEERVMLDEVSGRKDTKSKQLRFTEEEKQAAKSAEQVISTLPPLEAAEE